MNPSKVDAVVDWRTSINLKETQSFVDFYNFYRRFIKDFSKIVKSLIRLTRKDVIFEWSTTCQQVFNQLKIVVTQTPALRHFDRSKETILEIDSFDYVNGGVLFQYDDEGVLYSIAFYSKNLTSTKCNYQIYDKKLLIIIRCLEHWRLELKCTDVSVKIFTDHKGLMYFVEGRDLSRRQTRYLNMLFEYNIKIVYRSGSQNVKIDALIRITESKSNSLNDERIKQQYQIILTPDRLELDDTKYVINTINDPIYHRVVIVNKDNEKCSEIRDAIIEDKEKLNDITLVKCSIDDDILYHKNRLWVSQQIYINLIIEIYDQLAYDYLGVNRTYELLRREYY